MATDRRPNGTFAPGNGGRPQGSRNKLQADFIEALGADFAEHGKGVINIVRVERPADYLKIIAGALPKEFFLSDESPLTELSDADLSEVITFIRARQKTAA